jgi:catechol 2,3-dioxygenase-like lactoylglutathione lyase family enzyme
MLLEHVNLTVTDLDRSLDFYSRLLDVGVRWQGKALGKRGWVRAVHVGDDRTYLSLFESEEPGAAPRDYGRAGVNHFGFVVTDLAALRTRLADLGLEPHLEADYEPGRRLYLFDPDGHELEFVQYDD